MKRKWPIVEVEWEDSMAFGKGQWLSQEEVTECTSRKHGMTQYTSGYLMDKNRKFIVVVGSHADTDSADNVCGTIQIPRSAIRSLRILKEKE